MGCTLPGATNYQPSANMNDGTCRFPPSRCAMPITEDHLVAHAAGSPWPFNFSTSLHGGNAACRLLPSVEYDRCIRLVPPAQKSTDAIVTYPLPASVTEASVEVGLEPHAGRRGNAEFELRVVSQLGEVLTSDLVVRSRTGKHSAPALLRVVFDPLTTSPGAALQLVVNDEDGNAAEDLVVWADPKVYCDGSCPCTNRAASLRAAARNASMLPPPSQAARAGGDAGDSRPEGGSRIVAVIGALLGCAMCGAGALLAIRARSSSAMGQPRIIGKVQMMRRVDAGDERALMRGDFEDVSDDDDATARAEDDEATAHAHTGEHHEAYPPRTAVYLE